MKKVFYTLIVLSFTLFTLLVASKCFASESIRQVYHSPGSLTHIPLNLLIYHDDKRSVTCYVFVGQEERTASCVADSQLKIKP